jgi:hypothetical protein
MAVTPNYSWPVPVATDLVKDGYAAIADLGDAIDATVYGLNPGLVLIKTQTIGTAVSSVTVTGAFSATYDNYKIIVAGGSGSVTGDLLLSLGGITTAYYAQLQYNSYGATTPLAASTANSSSWNYAGTFSTNGIAMNLDVAAPFLSKFKSFEGSYNILATAGGVSGSINGIQASTTSATAFTLTTSTGTLTAGTIRVYGYKNS